MIRLRIYRYACSPLRLASFVYITPNLGLCGNLDTPLWLPDFFLSSLLGPLAVLALLALLAILCLSLTLGTSLHRQGRGADRVEDALGVLGITDKVACITSVRGGFLDVHHCLEEDIALAMFLLIVPYHRS